MKKVVFIFVFLYCLLSFLQGQESQHATYQMDTMLATKYYNLCKETIYVYPDSALKYSDSLLFVSTKANYTLGKFNAHNIKGILHLIFKENDDAVKEYHVALSLSDSLPDKRKKAMVLGNLGVVFRQSFMTDSALFYINKTAEYSQKQHIKDMYAKAIFELGSLYLNQDNYIKASKYLLESRDTYETLQDSNLLTYVYSTLGVLYLKVNHFDESLANFQKAIQLDESIPEINNVAGLYSNIGELYFRIKRNLDTALVFYRMAIPLAMPYQEESVKITSHVNIGNVFTEKMEYDSAAYYYQRAYNSPNISNHPEKKAAILVNLGILHLQKQEYLKARFFLEKGYEISKELNLLVYQKNALLELSQLDSISGNLLQS